MEEGEWKLVIWKNDDNKWEWNIELAEHINKGRITTNGVADKFKEAHEDGHKAVSKLKRKGRTSREGEPDSET